MMTTRATGMKQDNQSESSDASVRLRVNGPKQIPTQVYAIAKLLARVAVDEYLNSVLDSKQNQQ